MRYLLVILLLHFLALSTGAQPFHRDFPLSETGSPVRVNDMSFDARGFLWMATDLGLYYYNGRSFTRVPDSSAAPVSSVLCWQGCVWTGHPDGGVFRHSAAGSSEILKAGAPVSRLAPSPIGLLATTEGDGMYCIWPSGRVHLTTADGLADNYVHNALFSSNGPTCIIAATDRGISISTPPFSARGGKAFNYQLELSKVDIAHVVRPMAGAAGQYWAGFEEIGLGRISVRASHSPVFHLMDGGMRDSLLWTWGAVSDILTIGRKAYVVTETGYLIEAAWKIVSGRVVPGLTAYQIPGKRINRILRDRTGNLWLGTSEGLTMVTLEYLATLNPGPSYSLRRLSALVADRRNTLWYAQDNKLYSYDTSAGSRLQFTAPETITSLCTDAYNRLWIGTLGGGLACRDGTGRLHSIANVENLRGGHILNIASRNDTLWVSSLNGVEVLKIPADQAGSPRVIGRHGRQTGAGSDYIYQLYPDSRGRLWIATDGAGLAMWDGHSYKRWDSTSGFSPRVVYTVTEDTNGGIWAGTLEGGLYHLQGDSWKAYRREHGLQDNTILALATTASGSIVVVNEQGTDQWHPGSGEFRQYSRRMGLHIDSFSRVLNAVTRDVSGNVIVPYEHGFLVIKKAELLPDLKPRIALRSVELFFKPIDTSRHEFGADENGIGFRYEGIHFGSPERLHYRYRLEGYSDDWVETGDEAVSFSRLPPGHYTFSVRAAVQQSFHNAATATYSFRIAAPLWRRYWFWALAVTLGGAFGYLLLKRRDKARQRLAGLEQARLRAEYEHLKSQVNPHFLFNSLNTLVGLIEEDPEAAGRYTEQLSDLYRDTLNFRNRDLVLLEEEWAVLQKYWYIQQCRFGTALQLEPALPADILQTRRIIPLALQLLVENAIKHNVVSRAHPLVISITATGNAVTVRNRLRPKAAAEKSSGMGLDNIRSRYALLNAGPIDAGIEDGHFIVTLPLL